MKIKPEVITKTGNVFPSPSLDGLKSEMWDAIPIIDRAFLHQGYEAVLSCGTEPMYWNKRDNCFRFIHGLGSLHYKGYALDFSCRDIPMESVILIQREIQSGLDALKAYSYYQVIFESKQPHIHVEWDKR